MKIFNSIKKLKLYLLLLIPITIITQDQLTAQDDKLNIFFSQDFEHHNAPIVYSNDLWNPDWNYPGYRNSDHRFPGWWEGKLQDSIVIDHETMSKVIRFSFEDTIADGFGGQLPYRGGDMWNYKIGGEYKEMYFSYNIKFRPGWVWNWGGKVPNVNGGTELFKETQQNPHRPGYGEGFSLGMMFQKYGGIGCYFFYQNQSNYEWGETTPWDDYQPEGLDYDAEGRFIFDVSGERWYNITYRIVMNTFTGDTPNYDGLFEGFIDGKLIETKTGMYLITLPDKAKGTNELAIAAFFGGGANFQAPQRDEWLDMDDFICFTYADSVDIPRGNIPSPSGRVLELPNLKKVTTVENDGPTIPEFPDVSIIDVKNTNIPNIAITEAKISSFGQTELYDYGLTITKSEEPIANEILILASQDNSKIWITERASRGLKALYIFDEGEGNQILDNSGTEPPVNLEIQNSSLTDWLPGRGLKVEGNTIIASKDIPTDLINSITTTHEITLEAWIRPADINQSGPARIISLSKDPVQRAVTLGQEGNQALYNYVARLNTTSTDANGNPSVSTDDDFISLNLHHLVYTRKSDGVEKIFVNGQESYTGMRDGDFSSMADDYYLSIANEMSGDRPWIGTYYLLAIYNQALTKDEIDKNFTAGLGEIRFTTNLLVEPNVTYLVTPFTRTDQGVIYGSTEVLRPWSNTSISPFNDQEEEPYHGVDR